MARTHGKNADFSFNAVSIETELNNIVMNASVPEAEITAFADTYQNYLAGKKNVTTDISGTLDLALAAGEITIFDAIGAGPVTTLFDLTGSGPAADNPEYQCTAAGLTGVLVSRYHISLPVGDKASYSATLQHSGSTTRALA